MIFISLGSQQYQFDRLLKQVDKLVEKNELPRAVFAQTGRSTYIPEHFDSKPFLTQEEYENKVDAADIVITHAGTGAIIKALKAGKQVIVVPRQAKYGEHSDNHQFQIADFMEENGYVFKVVEMSELIDAIHKAQTEPKIKKFVGTGNIVEIVEEYISMCKE